MPVYNDKPFAFSVRSLSEWPTSSHFGRNFYTKQLRDNPAGTPCG